MCVIVRQVPPILVVVVAVLGVDLLSVLCVHRGVVEPLLGSLLLAAA